MTTKTPIEWATEVWNFVRGCRRVSPGCGGPNGQGGCYAEKVAHRFSGPGQPYEGLVTLGTHGPRWNGKGLFLANKLAEPLSLKPPSDGSRHRIFVNSMSDLFFEEFTFEEIAAGYGVMAACPQHDFLVLTKRPERALEFYRWILENPTSLGGPTVNAARGVRWHAWNYIDELDVYDKAQPWIWPLPNVWLGVSAEDQERADERIPRLLQCPAAVRFVSYEPALGPVDFSPYLRALDASMCERCGYLTNRRGEACPNDGSELVPDRRVDWLIVGGESQARAREFHLEWARQAIAQCREANVPCFVKQLGAEPIDCEMDEAGVVYPEVEVALNLKHPKGSDWAEWPKDLRVREFPKARVA